MRHFQMMKENAASSVLLHRYGFGQIARLVHVGATRQRRVIRQQLQRRHVQDRRQFTIVFWQADHVHAITRGDARIDVGKHVQLAAEAYPAGELKHGPLALVTEEMPVVTIAPNDALLEKLKSNMQEVRARGGQLYVFADVDSRITSGDGVHVIRLPEHYGLLSPILHVAALQLLAYHTALARGTDVDKPRNLAKSVTVE